MQIRLLYIQFLKLPQEAPLPTSKKYLSIKNDVYKTGMAAPYSGELMNDSVSAN